MNRHKTTVLQRLAELNRPAALSDIGAGLNIPERTLRRWLANLSEGGFCAATGAKKGRRYQITTSGRGQLTQQGPGGATGWSATQADYQPAGFTRLSEFQSYRAESTAYLSAAQRQRLALAARDVEALPDKRDALIIQCAFHSYRLDGGSYGFDEAERMAHHNSADSLSPEQIRLLNQLEACGVLFDDGLIDPADSPASRSPLDSERLRSLNYLLTDGLIATEKSGRFRDQTHVADDHQLPSLHEISQQIRSLLHVARQIQHPFEQSLFLLAYLTCIAPFIQANAATARACANWPLLQNQLPPLSFGQIERADYENAFARLTQQHDIGPLVQLYIRAYEADCRQLKNSAGDNTSDHFRAHFRQQRRALIRDIVCQPTHTGSHRQHIERWAQQHIPESSRVRFIRDTINDLARLAPFNLSAFGINQNQWQRWRQHCIQNGIRFKNQKVS